MKLRASQIRALIAVRDGLVSHRFDMNGNLFEGPKSVSPTTLRSVWGLRLIEDVPGQRTSGGSASRFKQQLTAKGREALTDCQGKR